MSVFTSISTKNRDTSNASEAILVCHLVFHPSQSVQMTFESLLFMCEKHLTLARLGSVYLVCTNLMAVYAGLLEVTIPSVELEFMDRFFQQRTS